MARDPQAVYDLNFAAVKIGEHPDVRLPVLVAYDGFFTSHQKRRIEVLTFRGGAAFLGKPESPFTALDPRHLGHHRGPHERPRLINNKMQLAMEAARRVIPEVFTELAALTAGLIRCWTPIRWKTPKPRGAINTAAETAKEAADHLRTEG